MTRLNVYVPDDLADRARALGLNVSALTRAAITAELDRHATDVWLDGLPIPGREITHEVALAALDDARAEPEDERA